MGPTRMHARRGQETLRFGMQVKPYKWTDRCNYHRDAVEIIRVVGRHTKSAAVQRSGSWIRTFSHLSATTVAWPIASESPDSISIELASLDFLWRARTPREDASWPNKGRVLLQLRGHMLIRFSSGKAPIGSERMLRDQILL
jgi:hypothetical protein